MSLLRSFAVKAFSNSWTVVVGLLTSIVLTRSLGPNDYGALLLAYAATMFCWNFVDLGMGSTLSRYLPAYTAKGQMPQAAALVCIGWFWMLVGLVVFGLGLWNLAGWVAAEVFRQPHLVPFIQLSVAYLVGFSMFNYSVQFLQATQSWMLEGVISACYPTLYLLGCVTASMVGRASISSILLINASAGALTAALVWGRLDPAQRRFLLGAPRPTGKALREAGETLVRFGIPMLLSNLIFFLVMWADKILISRYHSLTELTYYYIGFAFFNALMVGGKSFYAVLLPYISRVAAATPERLPAVFHTVFLAFFQIAVGVSVMTYVYITLVVRQLYGPTYGLAATVCRWLLAVFILRFVTSAIGLFLLNAFGRCKTSSLLSVVLITCQVGGDLLLVPRYGWLGAVWAAIVAYAVYGALMALAVKPIRQLFSSRLLMQACSIGAVTVGGVALAAHLVPSLQLVTTPVIVLAVSLVVFYPLLQERYRWKPHGSSLAVLRWLSQQA